MAQGLWMQRYVHMYIKQWTGTLIHNMAVASTSGRKTFPQKFNRIRLRHNSLLPYCVVLCSIVAFRFHSVHISCMLCESKGARCVFTSLSEKLIVHSNKLFHSFISLSVQRTLPMSVCLCVCLSERQCWDDILAETVLWRFCRSFDGPKHKRTNDTIHMLRLFVA